VSFEGREREENSELNVETNLNEMTPESSMSSQSPLTVDSISYYQVPYPIPTQQRTNERKKESRSSLSASHLSSHAPPSDSPKFVLSSVSGASPTLKESLSNSVTVKQAPFTAIESPMWQSSRMGEAEEKVKVNPPSVSSGMREVRVAMCSIWRKKERAQLVGGEGEG